MTRARQAGLAMLLAVPLSGCTVVGGSPPAPADTWEEAVERGPARRFGGSFEADGSRVQLVLELRGGDEALLASLELPDLEVTAWGEGTLIGGRLVLQMRYHGDCPGRMRLIGSLAEDGYRAEGRLTATDCTGTEDGPFVLLLRPS